MPLARFNKLAPERQAAILDPAAEEFAARGYKGSNLNQIIERTGISKTSMYYYFEDKQDLYATVLTRMKAGFLGFLGGFEQVSDPETFWQQARQMSHRSMEYYAEDPTAVGLLRSLSTAQLTGECRQAVVNVQQAVAAWWAEVLRVGKACDAIRTDLPDSLMIRLLTAICDAADLWCGERIDRLSRDDLAQIAETLADSLQLIGSPAAGDDSRRHVWARFRSGESRSYVPPSISVQPPTKDM